MPRALKRCPCLRCPGHTGYGCNNPTDGGRCMACRGQADNRRGTRQQRGYGQAHQLGFRPNVLAKDPLCVCTELTHGHGPQCLLPSTVADHYPLSRRELVAKGMDPDDPTHGRGLCESCHNRETAARQPGGWHGAK